MLNTMPNDLTWKLLIWVLQTESLSNTPTETLTHTPSNSSLLLIFIRLKLDLFLFPTIELLFKSLPYQEYPMTCYLPHYIHCLKVSHYSWHDFSSKYTPVISQILGTLPISLLCHSYFALDWNYLHISIISPNGLYATE